jgi:hypothetical protein
MWVLLRCIALLLVAHTTLAAAAASKTTSKMSADTRVRPCDHARLKHTRMCDEHLAISHRVDDLIARLTLDEKVAALVNAQAPLPSSKCRRVFVLNRVVGVACCFLSLPSAFFCGVLLSLLHKRALLLETRRNVRF